MSSDDDGEDSINQFFKRSGPIRMPSPTLLPRTSSDRARSSSPISSDLEVVDRPVLRRRKDIKGKRKQEDNVSRNSGDRAAQRTADDLLAGSNRKRWLLGTASQIESWDLGGTRLYAMAREYGWKDNNSLQKSSESIQGENRAPQRAGSSSTGGTPATKDGDNLSAAKTLLHETEEDRVILEGKGKSKAKVRNREPKKRTSTFKRGRDNSPSPQLETVDRPEQPSTPKDFWGVSARPKVQKGLTSEMTISERLRRMSNLPAVNRPIDIAEIVENEHDESDSDHGESLGYERSADREKRLRCEKLEALKKKRANKKQAGRADSVGCLPAALARQGAAELACPICGMKFSVNSIQDHVEACLVSDIALSQSSDIDIIEQDQFPPDPGPPPLVETIAKDALAQELFPSSPARPSVMSFTNHRNGTTSQLEPHLKRQGIRPRADGDFVEDQSCRISEQTGQTKRKRGQVVIQDLPVDEEDEDDMKSDRGQEVEQEVMTAVRLGPPQNGSPPPTGSIYISTMPAAIRKGFAAIFAVKTPRGDAVAIDDENYGISAQKKQATAAGGRRTKGVFRPRSRFRGGGRGRGKR
ncbi:hypothetical protein OIV83_006196 [Microbotryomycetes sp. JL201]|nr:hypothetical protein OIV83_006196 [Microbotryomycetes sp. JL201]